MSLVIPLTLDDLDEDAGLVIGVGSEDLGLLGGDGSVSGDEDGHDTTSSLNTLRKRSNIKKKEILNILVSFTSEDGSLDGSTVSNGLIGVDGSVGLLSVEEVLDHGLDFRDSS